MILIHLVWLTLTARTSVSEGEWPPLLDLKYNKKLPVIHRAMRSITELHRLRIAIRDSRGIESQRVLLYIVHVELC